MEACERGPLYTLTASASRYFNEDRYRPVPDRKQVLDATEFIDSIRGENTVSVDFKGKTPNIIIILEESMGYAPVEAPVMLKAGRPVTPFFRSLKKDSLLYSTNLFSPTNCGKTCECELEILTSCFPYSRYGGVTYSTRMDRDYKGLPALLKEKGYHTVVLHPNDKRFWHRKNAYARLGFDRFYSKEDFRDGLKTGLGLCDEEFLLQTAQKLKELPEPYFAFIITLSAHSPYSIPDNLKSGITEGVEGLSTYNRNHLETINYADRSLKKFWDETPDIREKAIIVVVGDHEGICRKKDFQELGFNTDDKDDFLAMLYQVPVAIVCPPHFKKPAPYYDIVADQTDIAPTLLEILDMPVPGYFVGTSMFRKTNSGIGGTMTGARTNPFIKNQNRLSLFSYEVSGNAKHDNDPLLKEGVAAMTISDDIIWGKRYSYQHTEK